MPPEDEVVDTSQDSGTGEITEPVAQDDLGGGSGINPAWQPLLEKLPSSLHSLVTPDLTEWDKNFQSKVNEVHSQYAPYKDYLDNGIAPENINAALQLLEAVNQRPLDVMKSIEAFAKENGLLQDDSSSQPNEQQGQGDDSDVPTEWLNHPKWQEMEKTVQAVAQYLVQQNEQTQAQQEQTQLASELETLKTEKGEFDEDWVLTKALEHLQKTGKEKPLAELVDDYRKFEQGILERVRKPGPKIMPPGGNAPNNQVDVKKLDDKGRRQLVMQMLQGASQNGQ